MNAGKGDIQHRALGFITAERERDVTAEVKKLIDHAENADNNVARLRETFAESSEIMGKHLG